MKRLLVCCAALFGALSVYAQPWQRNFVTTNTALTINFNDAGAHRIWGWDNTDNQAKGFVIGAGLSYDAATDTLTATGLGSGVNVASGYTGMLSTNGGANTVTIDTIPAASVSGTLTNNTTGNATKATFVSDISTNQIPVAGITNAGTAAYSNATAFALSTRTITVAGTANQITSSAGAQDLSANRTWTLAISPTLIVPGNLTVTSNQTINGTQFVNNMVVTQLVSISPIFGTVQVTNRSISLDGYTSGAWEFIYPDESRASIRLVEGSGPGSQLALAGFTNIFLTARFADNPVLTLQMKAAAGGHEETGDLLQFRDSSSNLLSRVSSNGVFFWPSDWASAWSNQYQFHGCGD